MNENPEKDNRVSGWVFAAVSDDSEIHNQFLVANVIAGAVALALNHSSKLEKSNAS